jgi:hypothetical protein
LTQIQGILTSTAALIEQPAPKRREPHVGSQ